MAERGYRNRAYVFDESDGGQSSDRRSNSSSSSWSTVGRFIEKNIKSHGRMRWVVIVVGIVVGIVLIAAISATIYFVKDRTKDTSLKQADGEDMAASSTMLPLTASGTPPPTTTTAHMTSHKATTTKKVVRPTTTKPAPKPTATNPGPTSVKPTLPMTSPAATTPFVDNSTPSNLTVAMEAVLYHVGDAVVKVTCRGLHSGDWTTLTIRKQFKGCPILQKGIFENYRQTVEILMRRLVTSRLIWIVTACKHCVYIYRDGYEPIAVAMHTATAAATVTVFSPGTTHKLVERMYEAAFSVRVSVNCSDVTNYSCAIVASSGTANQVANLSIYMPQPEIIVPHVVIENHVVNLQCIVDTWGTSGTIEWEFKPPNADGFVNFSVQPTATSTRGDCFNTINSSLVFNASIHENGSDFRCKVVYTGGDVTRRQILHKQADVRFLVVSGNFCDDKPQFSIHPHPHYPCSMVVYCLKDGPTVYEIECDPGECYDVKSTKCVPANR